MDGCGTITGVTATVHPFSCHLINTAVSVVNPRWTVVLNPWGSVLVISILVCCTKDNGRTAFVPPLYIMHDPRVRQHTSPLDF